MEVSETSKNINIDINYKVKWLWPEYSHVAINDDNCSNFDLNLCDWLSTSKYQSSDELHFQIMQNSSNSSSDFKIDEDNISIKSYDSDELYCKISTQLKEIIMPSKQSNKESCEIPNYMTLDKGFIGELLLSEPPINEMKKHELMQKDFTVDNENLSISSKQKFEDSKTNATLLDESTSEKCNRKCRLQRSKAETKTKLWNFYFISSTIKKPCFKRWRKQKDRKAFKMLQEIWSRRSYDLEKFITIDSSKVIDHIDKEFTCKEYSEVIGEIAFKLNWMRNPIYLLDRFKRIFQKYNKLSVRDIRFLKSLLKLNRRNDIDTQD